MTWRPIAVREGTQEPDGPYEDIPRHLKGPLEYWLERLLSGGVKYEEGIARRLTAMLRIPFELDRNYPKNIPQKCSYRDRN